MKKKKWKKIFCRMLAVVMSILMMPTSVFAQISVDSAKKIDDWWLQNTSRKFSSFDSSKALTVKASYGFRLYKTKNSKFTVEEGKSCKYPTSYNGSDPVSYTHLDVYKRQVTIKGFVRFETGEGIEKKEEDFAAEVAAQLK